MHALQTALESVVNLKEELFHISEKIASNPMSIGLLLEFNRYWRVAYALEVAGLEAPGLGMTLAGPGFFADVPLGAVDFSRKFAHAEAQTSRLFGGKRNEQFTPFVASLLTRPALSFEDVQLRDELSAIARSAAVPALLRSRLPPRLVAAPGDSLTVPAVSSGTLGGFLRDSRTCKVFASTCGHVVSVNQRVLASGQTFGSCSHSQGPTPLAGGSTCGVATPGKTRVDLALIPAPTGPTTNVATGIAQSVYSGDVVDMHGATSGRQRYQVGGLCITLKFASACWDGVFEVRPVINPGIVPTVVKAVFASVPSAGDSGAWILRGAEWCGVLVAADHYSGYVLPADQVLKEANSAFKLQLALA